VLVPRISINPADSRGGVPVADSREHRVQSAITGFQDSNRFSAVGTAEGLFGVGLRRQGRRVTRPNR